MLSPDIRSELRVVRYRSREPGLVADSLTIHEVEFDGGEIITWSYPLYPTGASAVELIADFWRLMTAFDRPVLSYDQMKEVKRSQSA